MFTHHRAGMTYVSLCKKQVDLLGNDIQYQADPVCPPGGMKYEWCGAILIRNIFETVYVKKGL